MKRLAAVALGLAIALPVCAQRGGGRGSFGSRSAPAFHSAPAFRGSVSPAFHYGGARLPPAYRYPQRLVVPASRGPVYAPAARPTFFHRNHPIIVNRPRRYPRRVGIYSYPTSVIGFFPYTGFYDDGFSDSNYGLDSNDAPPYAEQPSDNGYTGPSEYPPSEDAQPEYAPYPQSQPDETSAYPAAPPPGYSPYPYPPPQPAPAASPEMQYVPGSADTVTLIFKNGRPPEQVRNYLATRTTLTVIDGSHHREIPIADLDVPATIKANRETGVGFQLPSAAR